MIPAPAILLRERSLPRRLSVDVTVGGVIHQVKTGTKLRALLPEAVNGAPVVAALFGHKAMSLDTPVTSATRVEPLTTAHWEGKRIYRQSLGLLLLEAAARVDPGAATRLGPSMGYAQRVAREGGDDALPAAPWAERVLEEMRALVARDAPFRQELWTVDEARSHFAEQGWDDAALLLRIVRESAVLLVTCGAVYALGQGPMVPSAGVLARFPFGLEVAEHGFLLRYGDEEEGGPSEGAVPHAATPSVRPPANDAPPRSSPPPLLPRRSDGVDELWLGTLGITSVGAFNQACVLGSVPQIIRVCEGLHEKRIGQIADTIAARAGALRVICIAGPSSSGKTTFIKRLTVQLQVDGIHPVALSLDDYYLDREKTAKDAAGEYDFEAFAALDARLLQDHLGRVLAGEAVRTARFDFATGLCHPDGGPVVALGPSDVLLLEGIHGLNPGLLGTCVPPEQVFRVFLQPMTALPFDALTRVNVSDLRLLRRIVRDRHTRGATAARSIQRWPSVREGERRHIFPHLGAADALFDSSLVYEPSVIKVYADRYLLEVPEDDPAFVTAHRLRRLIDRFVAIYPDHVPPTSILREFMGGSGFEY